MSRVVIIGGGFAGIETALRLRKRNKDVEILLINPDDCFAFIPALYETAAGELSEGEVCILISQLLAKKGIVYYHDEVKKIDAKQKKMYTSHTCINYDILVLAIGATPTFYNIQGAEKFSIPLKTKEDAQKIFELVQQSLDKDSPHEFVICGGGLTGVEFAGSLMDHIHHYCKKGICRVNQYRVTLLERSPQLLTGLPMACSRYAERILTEKGVQVLTNHAIEKVSKKKVFTSQGSLATNLTIWTGGLSPHPLLGKSKFPCNKALGGRATSGGGLMVTSTLQMKGNISIYGVGDCISLPGVIKTAQNAIHQATVVAYNIDAQLKKKELKDYKQIENTVYCSLGKDDGMIIGRRCAFGKNSRKKKDQLEQKYVATLRKGALTPRLYPPL